MCGTMNVYTQVETGDEFWRDELLWRTESSNRYTWHRQQRSHWISARASASKDATGQPLRKSAAVSVIIRMHAFNQIKIRMHTSIMSCISFVFIAPPSNTWITESGQKPNVISVIERQIQAHFESVVKSPF